MGRWTMHEFRLDGRYVNTANQSLNLCDSTSEVLTTFVCKLFHVHGTDGLKFIFSFFKTEEIEIHTQSLPLLTIIIPQSSGNDVVLGPHLSSGNVPFSLSDDFLRFGALELF
ncbi:hypothetical protein CFP56_030896 [Quercus suber]|uniref:Uncharacterized protein n=1 Tax=Quercus suber TaxID=58331 RepID=A0AAW0JLS9_QUESU